MRIFHPLRSVRFLLILSGLSLSAIGDQLYALALTWIAVGVMGADAGFLTALQALVGLLALASVGRWADRWDRFRSMIVADLCRAAILIVVVGFWTISGAPNTAHLIAAIVVLAVGEAVFRPALQSVLPTLIDDSQHLPAANGLLDATTRTARLLGPGLVALLAGIVPVIHFLSIDALSFVASAAALAFAARSSPQRSVDRHPHLESLWRAGMRGVGAMRSHPLLGYALTTSGPANGAWYAVYYLALPLIIKQHGINGPEGSGLGAFGLVISGYGLTNLASTLVFGSLPPSSRPQFRICGGNLVVASGILLLVVASYLPDAWVLPGLMLSAAFSAIGGPMKDIEVAVLRQTRLRAADTAAAMRAYMAANTLGLLAAMLIAPPLVELIGSAWVMLTSAALIALTGVFGIVRHAAWLEPDRVRPA